MSFAASRFVRFNNSASIRNLIQRNFLRPSAVADSSVKLTEPPLSSSFSSEDQTRCLNAIQAHMFDSSEAMKKKKISSDRDASIIMFGLSGINQYGNVKINVRRLDEDDDGDDNADGYSDGFPTSNYDSEVEGFGNYDGKFSDSEDDFDDAYDEEEDSTEKRKFR